MSDDYLARAVKILRDEAGRYDDSEPEADTADGSTVMREYREVADGLEAAVARLTEERDRLAYHVAVCDEHHLMRASDPSKGWQGRTAEVLGWQQRSRFLSAQLEAIRKLVRREQEAQEQAAADTKDAVTRLVYEGFGHVLKKLALGIEDVMGARSAPSRDGGTVLVLPAKTPCPACGRMTRVTTAGCDHCGLEDK